MAQLRVITNRNYWALIAVHDNADVAPRPVRHSCWPSWWCQVARTSADGKTLRVIARSTDGGDTRACANHDMLLLQVVLSAPKSTGFIMLGMRGLDLGSNGV
jgi:hypothetical protein